MTGGDQDARPDVRAVLDFLAAAGDPEGDPTPEEARAAMRTSVEIADLPRGDLAVDRDLVLEGPGGAIPAALLDARADRRAGDVVVWFHGGGFVTGDVGTHRSLCAEVARQLDLPVLVVGYRLAPEAPFPAAHDDAEAACRWVASGHVLGFEVTGLVLAGDSCGGTLALATTAALRDRPAGVPVVAQLAIYPATDETATYASEERYASGHILTARSRRWFRDQSRLVAEDRRASPLLADPAGLPPTVVMTAGCDPVRDEGRALAARLVGAGVPTTFLEAVGNVHAFVIMRGVVPSSQADIRAALGALRALLPAPADPA